MLKPRDSHVQAPLVLDTNTLISAALRRASVPGRALERALASDQVYFSKATLQEFSDVLFRTKFDRYASHTQRRTFLQNLLDDALLIEVTTHITACRDPKDDKFLSLALAAHASHLITGDADLLALHPFRTIQIVSPRAFLDA